MKPLAAAALLLTLAGCAEAQIFGAAAIERRRVMNDMQARATVEALCDLSYGAVQRLTPDKRRSVENACGAEVPEILLAPETRFDPSRPPGWEY